MYTLSFIDEQSFKKHVSDTLASYNKSLKSINLKSFNSNLIDPIKLLFDKNVYKKDFEEILKLEIHRQRDKSNTNSIGYFHQNMFKYIANCEVPKQGWDVIFTDKNYNIYVEMKNKHNTMNAASSKSTYIKMQNQIIKEPDSYCFLVETLAPVSRNIEWGCSVDGVHCETEHIRRVSMDKFYSIVTGIDDAFYQMCMQLPETVSELIQQNEIPVVQEDTVIEELKNKNPNTLKALYLLAFESYEGFNKLHI